MYRTISAALAAAALALAVAPGGASAQSADEAQIRALQAGVAAAINARDVEGILKAYTPDVFVFDVMLPRQYVGIDAFRADWKGAFASTPGVMKVEFSDLTVVTDGTLGFGHSMQHYVTTAANGTKSEMVIRASDVYRKVDGHWLIAEEHLSFPIDFATGKADQMSKP